MGSDFPYDIYGFPVPDPKTLPSQTILDHFPRPHQIGPSDLTKPSKRRIYSTSQVDNFDPSNYGFQKPRVSNDSIDPVNRRNREVAEVLSQLAAQPVARPAVQLAAQPAARSAVQPAARPAVQHAAQFAVPPARPAPQRPQVSQQVVRPREVRIETVDPSTVHSDDPALCLDDEEEV